MEEHSSGAIEISMLFFPHAGQGHLLPMVDMAKLFASRGATVTILALSSTAPLITSSVDRAGIRLILLAPSASLRPAFESSMRDLRPDCVVTDMFMPWTYHSATALGIPRILFDGTGFFARCADHALDRLRPLDPAVRSFTHPGLPHRIELLFSQTPDYLKKPGRPLTAFDRIFAEKKAVDPLNYGVLVNSFYELEPNYVDHYRHVIGRKAWHVGPVALCNQNFADMSSRGGSAQGECLTWLDGRPRGSVVYVCFGSGTVLGRAQTREIARGLEATGKPFVWAVRGASEDGLPRGFEERIKGRGLLVRGWVPQLLILGHRAVGGFVTHCGWNSTLEGINAGLPMVTWPMFAEQFYNEKLVVDVLKVGLAVGSKVYAPDGEERAGVGAEAVEKAVRDLMGVGEEAEGRRRRARELGQKANRAVEKGGSSYEDVGNLIWELRQRKKAQMDVEATLNKVRAL
ncbi:hypothetical protein HPP92_026387 [Vanilla planifolia]|uniref:Glycosyltransferase n=1 Tax=Vanilla planifolia TaxID=51239 RepID=A0A835PEG0_VANPL|nr:hypothetical protein HPP92_026387 [Vanilla planifolia]